MIVFSFFYKAKLWCSGQLATSSLPLYIELWYNLYIVCAVIHTSYILKPSNKYELYYRNVYSLKIYLRLLFKPHSELYQIFIERKYMYCNLLLSSFRAEVIITLCIFSNFFFWNKELKSAVSVWAFYPLFNPHA